VGQVVMEPRDVAPGDGLDLPRAEGGQDVAPQHRLVGDGRLLPGPGVPLEVERGELGDGGGTEGSVAVLGRVLAASGGGEELLGLVPGLVGGHAAVAGDGEPPAAAAGVAVLD